MYKVLIRSVIFVFIITATLKCCEKPSMAFAEKELPVRCTGDSVTYNKEENTIYGKGNVEIGYKDNYLRADSIKVNLKTKELEAEGRVVVSDGVNIYTGDKLSYNLDTGYGEVDGIGSRLDPWFAVGCHGERLSKNLYYIKDGYVTTCDYEKPHYRIKAKDIYIYPEDKITAKHIIFYWGNVPLFYWPYFSKSLKDKRSPWTIIPGQSNKLGKFILIGYSMWWENFLGGRLEPTLRLDWYEKRGFGTGLYAKYSYKDKIRSLFRGYLIDDKAYERDGEKVHEQRSRFSADWIQEITPDTRGIIELNWLSDKDIVFDYFRDEFQDEIQTENYIDISKTTPWFQLNLMLKKRFHSFYTDLERLPELNLNFLEHSIGNTSLFYQGSASAGYLKKVFASDTIDNDYSSFRFDTTHQLRYPKKYFGWLNIIPRIGTRQTYYSKRAKWETTTTTTTEEKPTSPNTKTGTTTTTTTGNTPTTTTTTVTTTTVSPATTTIKKEITIKEKKERDKEALRSVYFTGAEFTTKMSRIFYVDSPFWQVHQLRHLIEPRIDYVYQHEPTVLKEDLLDFGDVMEKQHYIALGLRNKLQTRRGGTACDLVDLWIGTNYYPEAYEEGEGDERSFSHISADLKLRPFDWLAMDMDANWDQYDKEIDSFNTEMVLYRDDKLSLGLGYRYLNGSDKLWTSEVNYTVNSDWAFRMSHRFEFDSGQLQEQEYIVFRDLHCWNLAFTFREYSQIDEKTFFVVLYPKAYPDIPITFGTTYFGANDTAEVEFGDLGYDIDFKE